MNKLMYGSLVVTSKGNIGIVVDVTNYPKVLVNLGSKTFEISERNLQPLSSSVNKLFRVEFMYDGSTYIQFVNIESGTELSDIAGVIADKLKELKEQLPNLFINSIKTV